MGIFDSVYVDCPHCGEPVEFQSKAAADPYMRRYTVKDAPDEILADVINRPQHCIRCDGWLTLSDPHFKPRRPAPVARKVRTPANPKTHFQGFKWWPDNEPFTAADIIDESQRVPAPDA